MIRLLADENFNRRMLQGIRRMLPEIDIIRVQDIEIFGADDVIVLEWSAANGRIVLTHDVNTFVGYAFDRVRAGLPMPGVIEVEENAPIELVIEDLMIMLVATTTSDFDSQVRYIPIR